MTQAVRGERRYVRNTRSTGAEVVAYEVDMLRHCYERLVPTPPSDPNTRTVYVEAYLVHYRALLEFLAHPLEKVRLTDLTIHRPEDWASRSLSRAQIESVAGFAEPLHRAWFGTISQRLSHCTKPRYLSDQAWPIEAMHADMEDVLSAFARLEALG